MASDRMGLSARAWDRILRVARTIADLAQAPSIEVAHLLEALNLRNQGITQAKYDILINRKTCMPIQHSSKQQKWQFLLWQSIGADTKP